MGRHLIYSDKCIHHILYLGNRFGARAFLVFKILAKRDFCDLFWPRVTLTFDLLTLKLIISCPGPVDHLCQFTALQRHS